MDQSKNRLKYENRCAVLGYAYSAGRFRVSTPILKVGASRCKECPLFNSAGAYSGGSLRRVVRIVGVWRFTGMISSFLFRLSGSESEPIHTIRVPLACKV